MHINAGFNAGRICSGYVQHMLSASIVCWGKLRSRSFSFWQVKLLFRHLGNLGSRDQLGDTHWVHIWMLGNYCGDEKTTHMVFLFLFYNMPWNEEAVMNQSIWKKCHWWVLKVAQLLLRSWEEDDGTKLFRKMMWCFFSTGITRAKNQDKQERELLMCFFLVNLHHFKVSDFQKLPHWFRGFLGVIPM